MTRLNTRQALVDLVATAPTGLHPLAATALGLFDRWELLEALEVVDACMGWSDDVGWNVDAFEWMACLYADLADAAADNARLDQRGISPT